jgi:hypothetical protein
MSEKLSGSKLSFTSAFCKQFPSLLSLLSVLYLLHFSVGLSTCSQKKEVLVLHKWSKKTQLLQPYLLAQCLSVRTSKGYLRQHR